MLFYHVCYGHTETRKLFVPRIPKSVGSIEDTTYPRICVADSVDHAFSALCDLPYTTYDKKPVTIYTVDLPREQLIPPDYLFNQNLVQDSLYTREHWILFPVEMEGKQAYLRYFDSDTYHIPNTSKNAEFWEWMSENVDTDLLAPYLSHSVDDMIRNIIPSKWDEWRIDETDVCDDIGLDSMRVMYNVEILYE